MNFWGLEVWAGRLKSLSPFSAKNLTFSDLAQNSPTRVKNCSKFDFHTIRPIRAQEGPQNQDLWKKDPFCL